MIKTVVKKFNKYTYLNQAVEDISTDDDGNISYISTPSSSTSSILLNFGLEQPGEDCLSGLYK
jgi:hypothetical protein